MSLTLLETKGLRLGLMSLVLLGLVLLLSALPVGGAQPAQAVSLDIVISQVYGGGGNSGAPYTNDFVELFNRGAAAVDITGWSVQYASATGTGNFGGNPVTIINGSLAPGQYYLVQLAGGTNGVALPAPDAIGNANMSGSSGKVIVANQSAGLACNGGSTPCSSNDLAAIVDLVGYGSANFYEGSTPAPGLSNTTAALRVTNSCSDTDDNGNDFAADTPNPRNTASPLNLCDVSATPEVIITEIMYDPNSAEDNWEWIEIYNAGSASADLTGYVVDDFNSVAHSSANIAGGTLAAGEQAILFNADDVTPGDFAAAWGNVNLIPVTNWSAMALNNSGDQVSLWDSFASYSGDNVAHANAIDTVNYGGAGFPDPVGASIYLTNLGADNNVGSNWATSTDGGATPLFGGYTSAAAGGNSGNDVGSPGTPAVGVSVVINEIMQNPAAVADDAGEWFELYNPGAGAIDINGWTIKDNGSDSHVISNGGPLVIPAGGYLVLGNNTDIGTNGGANVDYNYGSSWFLANGDDEVILLDSGLNEMDRVEYDGGPVFPDPTGASMSLFDSSLDNNDGANWCTSSTPFGAGDLGTPGSANECAPPPPPEMCGDAFTPISAVQGNSDTSPLVGQEVAIEGVVVGDFQNNASPDNGELNGFHVQDPVGDGDATTSDGIFVYAPGGMDVTVGDAVRVRGFVSEYNGLTEIAASQIWLCGTGSVTPTALSLPVTSVDNFEAYEGMLVTFPQPLYISEYFNFDRFGEIVLTSQRHLTPSAEFEPGPDAIQAAQAFLLDKITLDDGRTNQNPDPAIHPNGDVFDLMNLFRGGDTVQYVTGVLDYAFGLYRIQPTQGAIYTNANPRTTEPDPVGGDLKIASFNVLNYFTTLDDGVNDICGPLQNQECRGADDANEFTRQRDKIIAALTTIDADIAGLIEIENNPGDVPTADLVSGLNDEMGAGTYDYIATGAIGSDAIRVAIIYKPASVSPVGDYAVLDTSVDPRFLDDYNRPVLAQTFMDNSTGGVFTVALNHLKSKGSDCNAIGDPDTGDGSGNCNLTRKAAAEALVDWLVTDPTGSGDADFLIMGDLNSYDKEDPIDAIKAGPDDIPDTGDDYTDMVYQYLGEYAYSYVFDGQLGYLDHALASQDLLDDLDGVTIWHINADEPDLIDYDTTFKGPNQDAIYAPDAYRSSDHDPVIVGLSACDEIPPVFDELSVTPNLLWPPNHKYVIVHATVFASDNFDPNPVISLVSVTSNEPDDGLGDGDTADDIVILDDYTFMLRAERSGTGSGRTYTITYQVTDSCGNMSEQSGIVFVPLSLGH